MIETGVVVNVHGEPIFWHEPGGRSSGALPDSRTLWDVLWQAQQDGWLAGFAHTHPGSGVPHPSREDISSFVAIENALGRPLNWWIASADVTIQIRKSTMDSMPGREIYGIARINDPAWVPELRRRSQMGAPYR
jgi:proteasome lid subunit RPN8/RPN11